MCTKQLSIFFTFFIVILITFSGCKKEDEKRFQTGWSSKDPIAIPFSVRNSEKNLGNLVLNPSFETGKIYYEESNVKSYDITGWKKVGQNIKWVNSNNGDYTADDVYEGIHAIKIERNKADETETTGEGIISDYIKVISGNYFLKLFLRLENICPNQARIGTKMYDAVNIKLQYFDKNKIEISAEEFNAFNNKKIDNGFKSLTLSNFWNIDEFGWGEIYGKTALYPFFDGDIPDETRYVKIFIGLKGTGTMWIDNVDFRYSNENFTMLERLKPYFDSSYLASNMVFPQPQKLIKKKEVRYYNQDSALYPVIVIPENANEVIRKAAKKFKENLISKVEKANDLINPKIEIVNNIDLNKISKKQFVISIGETKLYNDFKSNLPDSVLNQNKDSYYIFQLEDKSNMVFVNGVNQESVQSALHTLIQLFDSHSPVYSSSNIIDYPDFCDRALMLHYFNGDLNNLKSKLELLAKFKFNHLYFELYGADNNESYPFNSVDEIKNRSDLMNYSVMLDLIKLNAKQELKKGSASTINYKALIPEYAKSVLLAGDYYQVYQECNSDKVVYSSNKDINNNLQFDHIKLLNDFDKQIKAKNKQIKLEFLPPWSRLNIIDRGQGQAEFYYHDLNRNIPENISMYWTGGTFRSGSIDYAEYYRISDIVGTNPILYDNSLIESEKRFSTEFIKAYYAGKLRTLSLFEPYNLKAFDDFYKQTNERKILLNTEEFSELNTVRILTASNYYWNTKSYDPDKSLWIVLNKLYGRDNAINLIYFNDAYYGLKEICIKIEMNGLQYKNLRIAKKFETEMQKYIQELQKGVDNDSLLKEIEELKTEVLEKYNNLISTVK